MKIFPVLLDSRPAYLGARGPTSLLLLPLGSGTILGYLRARLREVTSDAPAVLVTFEASAGYDHAIREACPELEAVLPAAEFGARLGACEPSDWVLILDPSCFPAEGFDPGALVRASGDPRWVRHLVALDGTVEGTKECIHLDSTGCVRRIQRYYDSVTWPFTAGVAGTLFPVACTLLGRDFPFASLSELRRALASGGVPSRDVPLAGPAFDLARERDALELSERFVTGAGPAGRGGEAAAEPEIGRGCDIHPSARLVPPLILHEGVTVGPFATVIGPAVLGPRAHVGRNALVAQCLLTARAAVPAHATVRRRVVAESLPVRRSNPLIVTPPPGALAWAGVGTPLRAPEVRRRSTYARVKVAGDVALAALGLLLLAPLLALVAALVKIGSRGPILFGDSREGKDGKEFRCWKFRTMVAGAAALQRALYAKNKMDGPQFKLDDDPRVTRIGRILRRTNLDELPQLLNVVLGQMSLIGPRPSPFRENQLCVPWRHARLSVRPGITGLWQVCRHDRSSGDFHQWIHYDSLYVQHMSFRLDVKILAATILTLGGRWSVPLSWMIPPRHLGGAPDPAALDARSASGQPAARSAEEVLAPAP